VKPLEYSDPVNLKIILKKLDEKDIDILATIEALGVIPKVTSRRAINPEDVEGKLKISHKDYTDRLVALKKLGLLNVFTEWVAAITPNGLDLLEENRKSRRPDDNEKQAASDN
jgi:hypothetical protein